MRIYAYSPANYDFNANTPGTCMQACSAAGYAYASVSAGRLCFCGPLSISTSSLNATTTSCEVDSCTGDSTVYCGDINHELVYTSIGVLDVSLELMFEVTFSLVLYELVDGKHCLCLLYTSPSPRDRG